MKAKVLSRFQYLKCYMYLGLSRFTLALSALLLLLKILERLQHIDTDKVELGSNNQPVGVRFVDL